MMPMKAMTEALAGDASSVEYTASLATKPKIGGSPAIEAAAMVAHTATTGNAFHPPESFVRSRVPARGSMMPTHRNRQDLNRAWAMSRPSAAFVMWGVPKEAMVVRKPSWEGVAKASSSVRSVWLGARQPPRSWVTRPSASGSYEQPGRWMLTRGRRRSAQLPAVRMGAAWRHPLPGVGAALAPASQQWKGMRADRQIAPARMRL